jgi:molybdopterin synthase catalytic subunit
MPFLSDAPLDLAALIREVTSPDRGGIACFLGMVRDHHEHRAVLGLEYSAYADMVEAECARIVAETEARWPVRVALRHRVGALEIGEAAVAIAVAGAHRDEAFAGCRHAIEEVKRRVPIWKKERYADGSVEWQGSGGGARAVGPGQPGGAI